MKQYGKVAVLMGGSSAEREVSLMSGGRVLAALTARGVDAHAFDPAEKPLGALKDEGFDRVFLILHVPFGEDGTIKIAASEQSKIDAARDWIKSIASEPEVGQIYTGKVVKIVDFGAFVNFFGAKDGLVHISQLAPRRVQKTSDVVKEGDKVKVKLLGFDERGKVRLSTKAVDQQTGEDLEGKQKAEAGEAREAAAGDAAE